MATSLELAMSKERCLWVKVNRSSTKNDSDAAIFHDIMEKNDANFNTHTARAMWFNFETREQAWGFTKSVLDQLPYLNITIGNGPDN